MGIFLRKDDCFECVKDMMNGNIKAGEKFKVIEATEVLNEEYIKVKTDKRVIKLNLSELLIFFKRIPYITYEEVKQPTVNKENINREPKANHRKKKDVKFHLTHYKKIKLNKDISLRYFFTFEDRPNLVGNWVIKSHSTKEYSVIDVRTARLIANSHNKELADYKEIIGRYVNCVYRKVVIKENKAKIIYEPNVSCVETDKSNKE